MAKSTFLELCVAARRACGISGSGPTAVTGQVGDYERVVEWVALADQEIQSRWIDWDFMFAQFSTSTVIGTAAVSAPSDIGTWDVESFYLNYTVATNKKLALLDYKSWRKDYRQGVKTNSKSSNIVIKPDLSLVLESPPDAVYTLTADYWKRPVKMVLSSDTSLIPEEYERIIVSRVKMMYGEDQEISMMRTAAELEFNLLMLALMGKYLPGFRRSRGMSDAGMMVVRPE